MTRIELIEGQALGGLGRVLGLVPLDDRPVSWAQTVQLIEAAGWKVLVPPRRLLGKGRTPGRPEPLLRWLAANFGRARGWVVSLDRIAYGGLVASRELRDPLPVCLRRLEALAAIKGRFSHIPLYAFQAIRRKSSTVSSSADLEAWARNHRGSDPLKKHRRRNHAVNRRAARLCARRSLDVLTLLQEDATRAGPHKKEQKALIRLLARALKEGRAALTPGTDEGAMVLAARLIRSLERRPLTLRIAFSSAKGSRRVAPYEDRPIARTAAGQARAVGARIAGGNRAELELWVWCPDRRAGDLCFEDPVRTRPGPEERRFAARLADALEEGRRIALGDVAYANGADPALMSELARRGLLARLAGYGAWNTAGNALGSALALGALFPRSLAPLAVRLADDWGYQSVVRPVLRAQAREMGADEWRLTAGQRRALERRLKDELGAWARRTLGRRFGRPGRPSLPWNRSFEAEVPWNS